MSNYCKKIKEADVEGIKLRKEVQTLRELKASIKVQPAKWPVQSRTV